MDQRREYPGEPLSEQAERYEALADASCLEAEKADGSLRAEHLAIAAGWQGMARGIKRALSRFVEPPTP